MAHLRCFRHSYENILSKLRDLHISDNAREEIINDIFGKTTSDEQQLGLADAEYDDDFDVKLESVKLRWNNLEKLYSCLLSDESFDLCFYDLFLWYKAQEIKECMIKNVRKKVGLAENETFYTNTSEFVNRMKGKISKSGLNEFIDKLLELVNTQENEMKRVVCHTGEWKLHLDYNEFDRSKQ